MARSVLMILASFHPNPMGGSEIQALRLARELKKRGIDVSLIALGKKGQPKDEIYEGIQVHRIFTIFEPDNFRFKKKFKPQPVRIEYAHNNSANFIMSGKKSLFSFLYYFSFYFKALRFAKTKKDSIDCVYVPIVEWVAYIGTLIGKRLGKPVVIKDSTVNGMTAILRYPFGRSMRKTMAEYSYFVAMTRAIKANVMSAGVREEKIFSIPNGVTLPPLAERSNVDGNKFVFVGNLYQQPAKGVDVLLKAWKLVMQKRPEAQLYVIGGGNTIEYTEYVERTGVASNVHFLGKLKSFEEHLLAATALILPSRREGMSNALLEAMSYGVPCIATDISGSQDLVKDKVNGLLIPTEDEVALAGAVEFAYLNPGKFLEMGREARKTIETGYTLDIVAEQYFRLFAALPAKAKRP